MKAHGVKQKIEVKKTAHQKRKMRARWKSNHHAEMLKALNLPVQPLHVRMILTRTKRKLGYFDKKKTT